MPSKYRSILSAILSYESLFYSILIIVLSVIQTFIITKFLSPEAYGNYGFYIMLSQCALIVTQWGFTSWGVNELSKNEGLKKSILNNIISSKLILGTVCFALLVVYVLVFSGQSSLLLLAAFSVYVLSLAFSLETLYIASSKIEKLVRINLVSKLLYTPILIFLLNQYGITSQWLFMLFAIQSCLNAVLLYFSQSEFELRLSLLNFDYAHNIIKSWPNFMLVFGSFLFASGPVLVSGHFLAKEDFAVIYASIAIVKLVQASYQPMIQKILPKLNEFTSIVMDIKLSLVFVLIATGILFVGAPYVVKIIYNDKYDDLLPAIRLYSLSIVPGVLTTILVSQWAVYVNKISHVYKFIFLIALVIIALFSICSSFLTWRIVVWTMLISEWILFAVVMAVLIRDHLIHKTERV